jgi:hypothetical protein
MAYTTTTSVATGSNTTLFDKETDGLGPTEWQIVTDETVDVYFTGIFPESGTAVRYAAGTHYVAGKNNAIQKIEAQAVTTTASVELRPTIG